MPSLSVIDTGAHLAFGKPRGTRPVGGSGGWRTMWRLLPVLAGVGAGLQILPASGETSVCRSLTEAAQQVCGLAAAIPKMSDTPSSRDGDAVRVVAPLSADAFRPVPVARIDADPGSFLRQPIAVGPAQCFYFGVGDYRCVVTGAVPVVVAAPIVIPQDSQVSVEQGCGQAGAGTTRPCTYRIMVVPISASRAEPNQQGAVVLRTASIMAVANGAAASGADEQP